MESKLLSDSVLVRDYMNGNENALERLIMRHKQRVFSFIVSKVLDKEIAEDIFQDTFIKVVNTLKSGKYNEEGKFLPWVMRIAHNLSIDHFRRGKKMRMLRATEEFDVFDTMCSDEPHMEDRMIQEQIHQDVRDLLETLPEEQRLVVKMRIERDMSFQEIADETGVSINTALGRMRYALINLRKAMEERGVHLTLN